MAALAHESEIIVSRTAAGQIQAATEFAQPLPLELSVFPGIAGHATGLMGIHSTIFDDPTNDSYQMSDTADLRLILLAKTPGMEIWNDTGSAFMTNGQSYYVGVPIFDTHPIWNLVTNSPAGMNALTLRLHDVNGVYADSATFVLTFTALVPPTLEINKNAGQLTLSWPLDADDWTLESATGPTTTNWSVITNAPVNTGTKFSVLLDFGAAQKFYRLHKF